MPPPILRYARGRPRARWSTKAITVLFLAFGLLHVIGGLHTVLWPGHHTAYDMMIALHNAWVRVLFGGVLTVPAACLVTGVVRDEARPELPPGG